MGRDLKTILNGLAYPDRARVVEQIVAHAAAVKERMRSVRRKVLVMSGKGGVGKSTITAHLALALARSGQRVGVLDVDFNGPCLPTLLGVAERRLALGNGGARPVEGPLGVKVASLGFLLDHAAPVRWKGPMDLTPVWLGTMEMTVLRELLADVEWETLDWWLADLPPGAAADKPPALASLVPDLDGAIIVSTPSALAAEVVQRSVAYAREAGVRPLGLVVNMAGRVCAHCGHEESLFEGEGAVGPAELSRAVGVPLWGMIPMDRTLAGPAAAASPALIEKFDDLARRLRDALEGTAEVAPAFERGVSP
ncbi:MAG: P-loop NTPase [Nitrospirae bacterium]|nr:P-loop NTPase [Nitrospirota bacterium]